MAKIKKTTLDAGEIQIDSSNSIMKDFECKQEQNKIKVPINEIVDFKTKIIDKDIQNKLDLYDQLVVQNTTLLKEKNDLEAKLAEYIEENSLLKTTPEINENKNENEVNDLKSEINTLKESISQYLRRISDLTFENANLTAQLKELSSKSTQVQNTIPSMPIPQTRLEKPVYNSYKQNGYSSWN